MLQLWKKRKRTDNDDEEAVAKKQKQANNWEQQQERFLRLVNPRRFAFQHLQPFLLEDLIFLVFDFLFDETDLTWFCINLLDINEMIFTFSVITPHSFEQVCFLSLSYYYLPETDASVEKKISLVLREQSLPNLRGLYFQPERFPTLISILPQLQTLRKLQLETLHHDQKAMSWPTEISEQISFALSQMEFLDWLALPRSQDFSLVMSVPLVSMISFDGNFVADPFTLLGLSCFTFDVTSPLTLSLVTNYPNLTDLQIDEESIIRNHTITAEVKNHVVLWGKCLDTRCTVLKNFGCGDQFNNDIVLLWLQNSWTEKSVLWSRLEKLQLSVDYRCIPLLLRYLTHEKRTQLQSLSISMFYDESDKEVFDLSNVSFLLQNCPNLRVFNLFFSDGIPKEENKDFLFDRRQFLSSLRQYCKKIKFLLLPLTSSGADEWIAEFVSQTYWQNLNNCQIQLYGTADTSHEVFITMKKIILQYLGFSNTIVFSPFHSFL
jgi:hypothetical protein